MELTMAKEGRKITVNEAEPKHAAFDSIKELIESKGIQFAEFWFTELSGRPWRIAMQAAAVNESLYQSGLPLDGQPIGGSWDGVMILLPQFNATYLDPSAEVPTLAMICDILDPVSKNPWPSEPRHVLKRAEREVYDRLGATVLMGAEPEFTLHMGGTIACESAVWDFLRALGVALGDSGITIDWFRTGPARGQGRVQMRSLGAIQLADRVMLYRHAATNIARRRGASVSFLPRPAATDAIPGMPVHQALWKDGVNIFHDDKGWALASPLARWYAGGILEHLPALLAFCAPTTNSYRRLAPGQRAPIEAMLSIREKTAACRIPARSNSAGARRLKFCAPDTTANPYLAFAAIIMAGLDGIERRIEPPMDGGAAPRVKTPHCLEGALDALDADRSFLTRSGVFQDRMIEAWLKDRWTRHVMPVRRLPHPWELEHEDTAFFDAETAFVK